MMARERNPVVTVDEVADIEAVAAELFVRRRIEPWSAEDEAALERRMRDDDAFASAFRRVAGSWEAVGVHAAAPELMALREQAIARARAASARRWLRRGGGRSWRHAAVAAGLLIAVGIGLQLSPLGWRPGVYVTEIGSQRVVELADRSRIALDSRTRLRVRYTEDARIVELAEGQAQFHVARDPNRPFKVEAGVHTIVALGTVFNVEYVDQVVEVAMLEGKVAVSYTPALRSFGAIQVEAPTLPQIAELSAGEGLRVRASGRATVIPNVDLEAATAWRQGKVIFQDEPLGEAVRRLNRYSRLQLAVQDPGLAGMKISGVFDAGDTAAFVEAVESYLPVRAEYAESDAVVLRRKSIRNVTF